MRPDLHPDANPAIVAMWLVACGGLWLSALCLAAEAKGVAYVLAVFGLSALCCAVWAEHKEG